MPINAPSVSNNASDYAREVADLSHEAIARVANFVQRALEDPGQMKTIIQDGFATLFRQNPQFEIKAVNAFYEKFRTTLKTLPILERLPTIKNVTKMFEWLFSQSAQDTLNINATTALRTAKAWFESTQAMRNQTYHAIQDTLYTEVAGKWFPTKTA
jgi:hypothetical protein